MILVIFPLAFSLPVLLESPCFILCQRCTLLGRNLVSCTEEVLLLLETGDYSPGHPIFQCQRKQDISSYSLLFFFFYPPPECNCCSFRNVAFMTDREHMLIGGSV